MTIEQLRKAQHAQPFKPFSLRTADGHEYPVPHPDFLWIPPPGRTVMIADRDGAVDIVDLLLVAALHFGDGHAERRAGAEPSGN